MNKIVSIFFFIILFFVVICSFIIKEEQRGIILRFGKILLDNNHHALIYQPGLHIKFPFVDKVKIFDARIQTLENTSNHFFTKEKKDLIIDSYIKWRIYDFSRYYLTTGGSDTFRAEMLIKRKFDDLLYSKIGSLNFKKIITDFKGQLILEIKNALNLGSIGYHDESLIRNSSISTFFSSDKNNSKLINFDSIAELGIEIIDIQVKKINLPISVSSLIYNRMKFENKMIAQAQRFKGREIAEKLKVLANYEISKTLSEACRKALIIKGEGEAVVSKLFSDVFSQEPKFYNFVRSLQAYDKIFKKYQDIMIINFNINDFFHYINGFR